MAARELARRIVMTQPHASHTQGGQSGSLHISGSAGEMFKVRSSSAGASLFCQHNVQTMRATTSVVVLCLQSLKFLSHQELHVRQNRKPDSGDHPKDDDDAEYVRSKREWLTST